MPKCADAVTHVSSCTLLLAARFSPDSQGASAACKRPITVASSQVGRAMTILPDNSVHGAARDFLDLVARRTGCLFHYVTGPRARAWMMIETGRADVMPAAAQSRARPVRPVCREPSGQADADLA